jgi:NADPH:quinone reductase-like Zn-dependent oxidoreductase
MKSCWIVTRDHQSTLEYREVPQPQPRAGELLVEVHATALNRGELIVGGAVHGGPEKIGGGECAGVVHALGEGVAGWRRGERVFGRCRGGFAEYAIIDAHQAMAIPERLSWQQAAAVPISYITAYEMLWPPYGRLAAGEWLLVTGVSAGAGVASVQLARLLGARTIGTSGSAAKIERIVPLGLDVPIVTRGADFAARVLEATGGHGADLALNLVGGSQFAECLRSLARKGRLCVVGYVDGRLSAELDLAAVHAGRLEIYGISNARLSAAEKAAAAAGFARDVLPAIADGRVEPVIDRVFGFDELPAAKAWMDASAMVGKIVVTVR